MLEVYVTNLVWAEMHGKNKKVLIICKHCFVLLYDVSNKTIDPIPHIRHDWYYCVLMC